MTNIKQQAELAYFKDSIMSDMRLKTIKKAHEAGFKRGIEYMSESLVIAFEHGILEGASVIPYVCFCSCKNRETVSMVTGCYDICNNCRKYIR